MQDNTAVVSGARLTSDDILLFAPRPGLFPSLATKPPGKEGKAAGSGQRVADAGEGGFQLAGVAADAQPQETARSLAEQIARRQPDPGFL